MTANQYDNLLAIDTATRRLNLALRFGGDRLVKASEPVPKTHGQVIMKKIDDLFTTAALGVEQLDGLVVCLGPGSFTGLRIGLAVAKGLAVGRSLPVVGVSLFELAAARLSQESGPVSIIVPSRKGEYYLARIESGQVDLDAVGLVKSVQLPTAVMGTSVYGLGLGGDPSLDGVVEGWTSRELEYDASHLIQVGLERLVAGRTDNLATLEPAYLQKAIAEIRFDEKHGR